MEDLDTQAKLVRDLMRSPSFWCELFGGPVIDSPHGKALTDAVNRAADELEDQGPRSERIARQLLEALAHYELALGLLAMQGPPQLIGTDPPVEGDERDDG